MRTRALRTVAAAVVATGVLAVPAPAMAAATAVPLPITGAVDIVAARNHVYVSSGGADDAVVVTRTDGTPVRTIGGLPGAAGMAVSWDGHTVYVALPEARAIAAISTRTLVEVARYPTGDACPRTLAAPAGRSVFFGYNCGSGNWAGGIGAVDLAGAQPRLGLAHTAYYGYPLLAASPAAGVLVAAEPGLSPATVSAYEIDLGYTLTWLRDSAWSVVGSNLNDLAVSPDGTSVYTAAGAPYAVQELAVDDLTQVRRTYPTGPYPGAVAVSPGGGQVAGATYAPTAVHAFAADGTPLSSTALDGWLVEGALTWGRTSGALYAVTADPQGSPPEPPMLHVVPPPAG